jgi:cell wall-associated NlpC family hydrolase
MMAAGTMAVAGFTVAGSFAQPAQAAVTSAPSATVAAAPMAYTFGGSSALSQWTSQAQAALGQVGVGQSGPTAAAPAASAPAAPAAQAPAAEAPVATPAPAPATGTSAPTLGDRAVFLASTEAGKPYVYGAAGPDSFDCSGLVQYVYQKLGVSLPRTTQAQYAATRRVAPGSEQPGDLIFFGTPGNIDHVGIYAGSGKMWVAPHTGDVVKLEAIYAAYSVGHVG